MRLSDLWRFGAQNLLRRKTRTLLTALSMAVGVMCIVVLISVGLGYEQAYRESVEAMGSLTKIEVTPSQSEAGLKPVLNDKAVQGIAALPGVEAVTPVLQKSAYLVSGSFVNMVRVYGVDLSTLQRFQLTPELGELPQEGTPTHPEAMFTDDVAGGFANRGKDWESAVDEDGTPLVDPMQSPIRMSFDYASISNTQTADKDGRATASAPMPTLTVTGICPSETTNFTSSAFMDFDVLTRLSGADRDTYELLWVKAASADDVQRISATIREAGLATHSLNDMLNTVRTQSRQLQGMLGALGAVAVLISALCVANTMMMAISERTREVGILKVLGMVRFDVARMFLTEALMVGIVGGAIGLGLSYLMRELIPRLFADSELRCVIPGYLAAGGVVFSAVVALLSALLPARKATRISPNEAIRTE